MKEYKTSAIEYTLKANKNSDFNKVKIQSAEDAKNYAHNFYFDDIEIYESMFIMLLNRQNNTIGYAKISQGGVAGTVVDKKIIAKYAVESLASAVIMVHNHPSGNRHPSEADKKVTQDVKEALKLLDVDLLDHIILTPCNEFYTSLANDGLI